ncbi:cytochrome P450 82G1-like [Pistacia vera]|uniref:cytochrome P450 82G1-like n=1 Tax=Pistacia vera TaxID=55513 RepID=UPI0012632690|nr:cytochrome P450 82G1-like [Pistacia vera]
MEYFSSFTQSIIELLALLLLYHLWRAKANYRNKCDKKMAVPQPNGAWPLIGHFPLLSASVPVCKTLGAIADKCGPIYSLKLGKHQTLIVSSWEFVKECFTTNDRILATRPSISVGRHIGYDNAIFALAPYGPYWREIRKIATTDLLSSHRLEMLKHVRHLEIETLIKGLKLLCAKNSFNPVEVNMSNLIEHFTFNVNLKLIAGKRFSPREYGEQGSEAWRIERAIKEAIYLSGVFVAGDVIPWLEWMDFQGHVGSKRVISTV